MEYSKRLFDGGNWRFMAGLQCENPAGIQKRDKEREKGTAPKVASVSL